MYVTARGMRTSAPPHTDRQDVLVVQMEGPKRWRVFAPPTDGGVKPTAHPFARGKGEDSLPLHVLLEGQEGRLGTRLLMDVVTREGNMLFISVVCENRGVGGGGCGLRRVHSPVLCNRHSFLFCTGIWIT